MQHHSDAAHYRKALSSFGTGITVITAHWENQDWAMTCNSFSSVSLNPRLVLWSIRRESGSHPAFTRSGGYTVNVLAADQAGLVQKFAVGNMSERFAGVAVERMDNHRVRLQGAAAWFDCDLERIIPAGDHDILLGAVHRYDCTDAAGLGYHRSQFAHFEPISG